MTYPKHYVVPPSQRGEFYARDQVVPPSGGILSLYISTVTYEELKSSQVSEMSYKRRQPRHKTLTPGGPSDLRAPLA